MNASKGHEFWCFMNYIIWYSSLLSPEFWKQQEASVVDFLHCQQMRARGSVPDRKQIPPKNSSESQLIDDVLCGIKTYWPCCTNPCMTTYCNRRLHSLPGGVMQGSTIPPILSPSTVVRDSASHLDHFATRESAWDQFNSMVGPLSLPGCGSHGATECRSSSTWSVTIVNYCLLLVIELRLSNRSQSRYWPILDNLWYWLGYPGSLLLPSQEIALTVTWNLAGFIDDGLICECDR
jgi:hypothetical protein